MLTNPATVELGIGLTATGLRSLKMALSEKRSFKNFIGGIFHRALPGVLSITSG